MISLGLGIRTRWRRWRHGPPIDQDYVEARAVARLLGQPAAPLARSSAGPDGGLKVAIVVPFFRRGSGGHMTICNLIRGLERRGHACSVWIDDSGRRLSPAAAAPDFRAWFGPFAAPVQYGFDAWDGADVTVATGWQTVARVRQLGGSGTRAYLVQDHEPEFFPTSAQRHWAADSYRHGCYPITAGAWLATLMQEEYGLPATAFDLGVDTARYRPRDVPRRSDVVLFYARSSTPRRAVPLALAALAELRERRPNVELWFFGDGRGPAVDFPYRDVGIVHSDELARLYSEATVGLVLSMTNYSLIPQEMLACGLACVELDSPSVRAAYGTDGPVDLAPADPSAIRAAVERLLDDPGARAARVRQAEAFLAARTWDAAAAQVEEGLRSALRSADAGALQGLS